MKMKISILILIAAVMLFGNEFTAELDGEYINLKIEPSELAINAATYIVIYDAANFAIGDESYSDLSQYKIVDTPGRLAIYADDNASINIKMMPIVGFREASFELRSYLSKDIAEGMPNPEIDFQQKVIKLEGNPIDSDFKVNEVSSIAVFPNPFREKAEIKIDMNESQNIRLGVYDILGKEVKRIYTGNLESGIHSYEWLGDDNDGKALSKGIYFCRIDGEDFANVKQLFLMK